jgi:hypothetical protein
VFLLADIEGAVGSLKCFACNLPQYFHHKVVASTLWWKFYGNFQTKHFKDSTALSIPAGKSSQLSRV